MNAENLVYMASRPMTTQSFEIRGIYFLKGAGLNTLGLSNGTGEMELYLDQFQKTKYFSLLSRRLQTNPKRHFSDFKKLEKNMLKAAKALQRASNLSKKYRAGAYVNWLKSVIPLADSNFAPFLIDEVLEGKCKAELRRQFGDDADSYWEIIASPTELNDYQKMRIATINSKLFDKPSPSQIVKKYYWLTEYSLVEELFSESTVKESIRGMSAANALKEKNELLSMVKYNRALYKRVLKKIKSPELRNLVLIINKYVYFRVVRINLLLKYLALSRAFFRNLTENLKKSTGLGWSYSLIPWMTSVEILDYLNEKTVPEIKRVSQRKNSSAVFIYNGSIAVDTDPVKTNFFVEILSGAKPMNKVIGTPAYKGKVKGVAKIILSKSDLGKINPGDIFIAKTTVVEYIPYLKMAAAFVTDEGGVTCHAAVVSREMKKPCVVGTKISTRAFKDGDLLEVNADDGVVVKV